MWMEDIMGQGKNCGCFFFFFNPSFFFGRKRRFSLNDAKPHGSGQRSKEQPQQRYKFTLCGKESENIYTMGVVCPPRVKSFGFY